MPLPSDQSKAAAAVAALQTDAVQTTQIAPTILKVLGLKPQALQAIRLEHTHLLPGLKLGPD